MTKQEFETGINGTVSDRDYAAIEKVYMFHPAISDTEGKDQIAQLYKIGGMLIIRDMVNTAELVEAVDAEIQAALAKVSWLQKRQKILAQGNREYEEMLAEIGKAMMASDDNADYMDALQKIKEKYPDYDVDDAWKRCGC